MEFIAPNQHRDGGGDKAKAQYLRLTERSDHQTVGAQTFDKETPHGIDDKVNTGNIPRAIEFFK